MFSLTMGSICSNGTSQTDNDCNQKINVNSKNPFGNVSYNGYATIYNSTNKTTSRPKQPNRNVSTSNTGQEINGDQQFLPKVSNLILERIHSLT